VSTFGFDIEVYTPSGAKDELALHRMSVAFDRAGREFSAFGKRVFPLLQAALEKAVAAQFDAEGDGPSSGPWKPLSQTYAKQKARLFPGKPRLVRTGALRDALTQSSSPFANRAYTANEMQYGSQNVPYASFHQTGTERMPARPPFDFGQDAEDAINAAALQGAREAIRDTGLSEFATLDESDVGDREVFTGPRGGRYVVGDGGAKQYLRRAG
jgi:phage gpG-like protein